MLRDGCAVRATACVSSRWWGIACGTAVAVREIIAERYSALGRVVHTPLYGPLESALELQATVALGRLYCRDGSLADIQLFPRASD